MNDREKGRGWGEQHDTNHIATRYRAEREELRNGDQELETKELESKMNSNAYRKKGGNLK